MWPNVKEAATSRNLTHGDKGCVRSTRSAAPVEFLDRCDVQQAGGNTILEYWIPADDLPEFNANIVGTIEVVAEYR